MVETVVDLIRHGVPVGGRAIRGNGIDDALSELGFEQMRSAVLNYRAWDVIISSPMSRCVEFSKQLSSELNCTLMIEENFKEVGFGSWQGRTPDEIQQNNPKEYHNFYLDPVNSRPQGAEVLSDFYKRVVTHYKLLIDQLHGKRILIICHAGVIRAVICYILQAELKSMYRIKVKNAGISRIIHNDNQAVMDAHGFNLPSSDSNN